MSVMIQSTIINNNRFLTSFRKKSGILIFIQKTVKIDENNQFLYINSLFNWIFGIVFWLNIL